MTNGFYLELSNNNFTKENKILLAIEFKEYQGCHRYYMFKLTNRDSTYKTKPNFMSKRNDSNFDPVMQSSVEQTGSKNKKAIYKSP